MVTKLRLITGMKLCNMLRNACPFLVGNITARILDLSEEDLNQTEANKSRTVFEYRSAWARSYLKDFGAISNSSRSFFVLQF